jgi:hypothetical protein
VVKSEKEKIVIESASLQERVEMLKKELQTQRLDEKANGTVDGLGTVVNENVVPTVVIQEGVKPAVSDEAAARRKLAGIRD